MLTWLTSDLADFSLPYSAWTKIPALGSQQEFSCQDESVANDLKQKTGAFFPHLLALARGCLWPCVGTATPPRSQARCHFVRDGEPKAFIKTIKDERLHSTPFIFWHIKLAQMAPSLLFI